MSAAQDATVKTYQEMTPAELRAECERLDEVCIKQAVQIKDFTEGTLSMISDFSGVILRHMAGDIDKVRAGLDTIVDRYVTRVGDLH